jgi:hypothetical protein
MSTVPPSPSPSPPNPIARWFEVGAAVFSGIGCLSLMGAVVLIAGVNLVMPSDTPPAGSDATGQDVYAVVTAPFRGFRWLIDQISPVLVIVGLIPLLLGVALLIVSRGIARYRPWARIIGATLLLMLALLGATSIMASIIDGDYDLAGGMLLLALLPLYPFWLLVWRWNDPAQRA